jgi:hypothetical protein
VKLEAELRNAGLDVEKEFAGDLANLRPFKFSASLARERRRLQTEGERDEAMRRLLWSEMKPKKRPASRSLHGMPTCGSELND